MADMKDVKRYGQNVDFEGYSVGSPMEKPDGYWVKYRDYTELQAENSKLREALEAVRDVFRQCGSDTDINFQIAGVGQLSVEEQVYEALKETK